MNSSEADAEYYRRLSVKIGEVALHSCYQKFSCVRIGEVVADNWGLWAWIHPFAVPGFPPLKEGDPSFRIGSSWEILSLDEYIWKVPYAGDALRFGGKVLLERLTAAGAAAVEEGRLLQAYEAIQIARQLELELTKTP